MGSKSTFSNSTSESYALALYELSKENSELEQVEDNIKSLNQLVNESLNFKEMLLSPTITKEDKKEVIFLIADKNNFSKTLKKFLGFIAIKNRLFFLEKIIESFLNLISKNKGEIKTKLISSKELSKEEQEKIKNELSIFLKTSIELKYEYEPKLIVGLIFQIGSIMIDTSIKTKLKKLEKNMIGL